eukprot:scaffold2368_cov72-Phaeocystis_antarctica.AAC.7
MDSILTFRAPSSSHSTRMRSVESLSRGEEAEHQSRTISTYDFSSRALPVSPSHCASAACSCASERFSHGRPTVRSACSADCTLTTRRTVSETRRDRGGSGGGGEAGGGEAGGGEAGGVAPASWMRWQTARRKVSYPPTHNALSASSARGTLASASSGV